MSKQSHLILSAFVAALLLPAVSHAAEETRYISSLKANLLAEPNFKANKIAQLKKGQAVSVLESKGPWLKVSADNQPNGWLSKFLTKSSPPSDRVTVLPSDKETKLKDVRRRTSAITTAAAARGLAASSRGSKEDLYKSDETGVDYMESFRISDSELDVFAKAIRGDQ